MKSPLRWKHQEKNGGRKDEWISLFFSSEFLQQPRQCVCEVKPCTKKYMQFSSQTWRHAIWQFRDRTQKVRDCSKSLGVLNVKLKKMRKCTRYATCGSSWGHVQRSFCSVTFRAFSGLILQTTVGFEFPSATLSFLDLFRFSVGNATVLHLEVWTFTLP